MKQQNTTNMPLARTFPTHSEERDGTIIRQNSRLKNFFGSLFSSPTKLTHENWERFEFRKSPQSIRADARRDGIL